MIEFTMFLRVGLIALEEFTETNSFLGFPNSRQRTYFFIKTNNQLFEEGMHGGRLILSIVCLLCLSMGEVVTPFEVWYSVSL